MQNVAEAALDIYTQTVVTGFSPETWSTQAVTMIERGFRQFGWKVVLVKLLRQSP